uniref:Major facilitator superfamily (MFS) profile domain-containing protein n=1 Tax=Ditylenchus dipsaci TaxID=166011 RepID=A0A915DJW5_9BILA
MSAFNFTLICMTPPPFNETSSEINPANPVYPFTENQKAILMWSMAMGTLFSALPISWLYSVHIYGARQVLFTALVLSAVSTALFPLAASLGFGMLALLRLLQGVSYAADFAALGMLISRWAPLNQNAIFLSVVSSYSPVSSMITNSVAGVLCTSQYGWPMVFYSFAAVCLIFAFLWLYFYTDDAQKSEFVSKKEAECINREKSEEQVNMTTFVPYKAILKSKLTWIIWLNAFADLCSGSWTLMYQPSYFKYVLKYSVEEAGFLTAIPTVLFLPLKILSGIASDKTTSSKPQYQRLSFFSPYCRYVCASWRRALQVRNAMLQTAQSLHNGQPADQQVFGHAADAHNLCFLCYTMLSDKHIILFCGHRCARAFY